MVRLHRDLSGRDLARALRRYGYEVTRETGSHMRLATEQGGEHHVTIPEPAAGGDRRSWRGCADSPVLPLGRGCVRSLWTGRL